MSSEDSNAGLSEDDKVFDENEDSGSANEFSGSENEIENFENSRRKHKRTKLGQLFDTEAGYGDSEEEEEDDNDFVDNEIEERDKEFQADFQKKLEAHARRREEARKRFEQDMSPEDVEERLKQLYDRPMPSSGLGKGVGALGDSRSAAMQPSPTDPKLWLVKCRPGSERASVAALIRGISLYKGSDDLGIFSVIGKDSLKGFIYIEAHKVNSVMNAVQKVRVNHLIFASPMNRPVMVPLSEMTDVMKTNSPSGKTSSINIDLLKIGGWVRLRRGRYSGDLAQIIDVEEDTSEHLDHIVTVKLVPRLDFVGNRQAHKKDKPMQSLFDPQTASQYGSVTKSRGFWMYNGDAYKDGFLYKEIKSSSLSVNQVEPKTEELDLFLLSVSSNGPTKTASTEISDVYAKGDSIMVNKGEFKNLKGTIVSVPDERNVLIKFDQITSLNEPVLISKKFLQRDFSIGDIVSVNNGPSKGKSGMVVSFSEDQKECVLFNTSSQQQFTVPTSYISNTIGNELLIPKNGIKGHAAGKGSNKINVHDIVSFGQDSGIVIKLNTLENIATVHDSNNNIQRVSLEKLTVIPKPTLTGPARWDKSTLKSGDRVEYTDSHSNIRGSKIAATIFQIYSGKAFIHCIENGRILAVPKDSLSHPQSIISKKAENRVNVTRGPALGHLIGKSIRIGGAGPHKGLVGIVKEITDSVARIELHTDSRVVSISKDRIVDPSAIEQEEWNRQSGKTPAWGGQSGKTPAWGGQSGKTPNTVLASASHQQIQSKSMAPSNLKSWLVKDAVVKLKSSDKTVVIESVLGGGVQVKVSGHSEPFSASELIAIKPGKKDTVRLLKDDGVDGTVIGLDGPDAVIRVEGTADFRIVPLSNLVKISK